MPAAPGKEHVVRLYRKGDEERFDLQDPRTIDRWLPAARWMRRYFRYRVEGIENVPTDGAALITMNHGALPVDAPLLGLEVYERTGRLTRALTDHVVFRLPGMREFFLTLGAVDRRHDTAGGLLRKGNLVIVMPGGAPEAFKPSSRAYEISWRMGFARLAVREQVPVVPAVCISIDDLYTIPIDMFEAGRRLLGVRSVPLPLAWGIGPLPRPARLVQYLGAPIHSGLPPEAADDDDAVRPFRDRVVAQVEAMIAEGLRRREEGTDRG